MPAPCVQDMGDIQVVEWVHTINDHVIFKVLNNETKETHEMKYQRHGPTIMPCQCSALDTENLPNIWAQRQLSTCEIKCGKTMQIRTVHDVCTPSRAQFWTEFRCANCNVSARVIRTWNTCRQVQRRESGRKRGGKRMHCSSNNRCSLNRARKCLYGTNWNH